MLYFPLVFQFYFDFFKLFQDNILTKPKKGQYLKMLLKY